MRVLPAVAVLSSAGFAALVTLAALAGVHPQPSAPESVDFNGDVRPILSGHCFKCHGPDDKQRQAGLRLDTREGAVGLLKSGRRAIVGNKPDQSELVRRILASGPTQMPPATANKPLTDRDKWILRKWVADGAKYEQHWAFVPPKLAPLPRVKLASWPRNPIDTFTLARMEAAGLKPSPEADRCTLCRRL